MNSAEIYRYIAGKLRFEAQFTGYICDALTGSGRYAWDLHELTTEGERKQALAFLQELGMGRGFREFLYDHETLGGHEATPTTRARRADWLLFAADIAEEWGVE